MPIFCFCWFLLLYSSAFIWAKNKDFFSPVRFVATKYALLNLCFILFVCIYPSGFYKQILTVCNVTLDQAFLQYTIVQTVAFISLMAGITLFSKKQENVSPQINQYNYRWLKNLSVIFFAIGCTVYGIFLNRIGGLVFLLTHLNKRIQLQGNQYILNLLPLLVISCIMLLLCIKLKNKVIDKVLLVLFSLATLAIFTSFGSRESSLIFIITLIVAANYIIRQFRLDFKNLAVLGVLGFSLFFYIIIIPVIRSKSELEQNPSTKVVMRNFVYNISYTYIDVFAANYYNRDNAWYLDGFFDPVTALFADNDKSMIPQVDQGVYFNSIVILQKDLRPPLPRKQLSTTSWPTENFGFAYANFLLPGIVVFFFLQGMVFSYTYRALKNDIYNPLLVVVYVLVIFTFNFSSLRLAGFIKTLPLIYLAYIMFNRFVKSKSFKNSIKINI